MSQKHVVRITKRARARITGVPASGQTALVLDADVSGSPAALAASPVGTPATMTLIQAADRLGGGEGKTADEHLETTATENRRLEQLIESCREDTRAAPFPTHLPTVPIEALIEKVASLPGKRPKSVALLLRIARQVAAARVQREAALSKALKLIINEARADRLTLWARPRRRSTAPMVPLPLDFLINDIGTDTSMRHLCLSQGTGKGVGLDRAIIAPTGDRSVAYFDVVVTTDEFMRLFKARLPVCQTGLSPEKIAEIEAWYRDVYVCGHVAAGTKPGRDEDLAALRQKFGHELVSRPQARGIRRKWAPEAWPAPGAPKKSGKT